MNAALSRPPGPSEISRRLMLANHEHVLTSNWRDVIFLHFEVDATALQREVPFELDLYDGKAYVSLVGFHLQNLSPVIGGRIAAWLMKPVSGHELLNVRTYVRHRGESGIYFLAEFLPNRLSLQAGPLLCGLPYRFARLLFEHRPGPGRICGVASNGRHRFLYHGETSSGFEPGPCDPGGLDEFLVERYTAFTHRHGVDRYFRVWHPPWRVLPARVTLVETGLLAETGGWMAGARLAKAHYSAGFNDVWMGWPTKMKRRWK